MSSRRLYCLSVLIALTAIVAISNSKTISATTIGDSNSTTTPSSVAGTVQVPSATRIAAKFVSMNITAARLLDSNPAMTEYTNVSLLLCVPNHHVLVLASNRSIAMQWIQIHVLHFHRLTEISKISVVISYSPGVSRLYVLQAMQNVHLSLADLRTRPILKLLDQKNSSSFLITLGRPYPYTMPSGKLSGNLPAEIGWFGVGIYVVTFTFWFSVGAGMFLKIGRMFLKLIRLRRRASFLRLELERVVKRSDDLLKLSVEIVDKIITVTHGAQFALDAKLILEEHLPRHTDTRVVSHQLRTIANFGLVNLMMEHGITHTANLIGNLTNLMEDVVVPNIQNLEANLEVLTQCTHVNNQILLRIIEIYQP